MRASALQAQWCLSLRQRGLAERTIRGYVHCLKRLGRGLKGDFNSLTRKDLERCLDGARASLSPATYGVFAVSLKVFCGWMYAQGHTREDLREWFPRVRKARRKVQDVPSVPQVRRVILTPDVNSPRGYRDRAMILTQYAGGMRSMELAGMKVGDFDAFKEVVRITRKGGDEQVIPVGPLAAEYLASYEQEIRPQLHPLCDAFWINDRGGAMLEYTYRKWVKKYLHQAGLKTYSTHSFRHAAATHMVLAGAPIHAVSSFLGHKCLQSTEIYTRADLGAVRRAVERVLAGV